MKISSFTKIAGSLMMTLCTTILHGQSKQDSLAIQAILSDEVVAWNKGDAELYSRQFAQDGTFTNIVGMFFTGHKNFLERHDQIFKGPFNKTGLTQKIVSFRFIRPEVATVETLCEVSGFSPAGPPPGTNLDAKGRLYTRLLQVMVRQGADWKIVSYHNVDLKPGIPIPEMK